MHVCIYDQMSVRVCLSDSVCAGECECVCRQVVANTGCRQFSSSLNESNQKDTERDTSELVGAQKSVTAMGGIS